MEVIRWTALAVLILFAGYTIYAGRTEPFWRSHGKVVSLKWGRQIVMDVYIGLFLFNFIVYLNEGSLLVTLAWLIPSLILGNFVPLIYLILNFNSLLAHFM